MDQMVRQRFPWLVAVLVSVALAAAVASQDRTQRPPRDAAAQKQDEAKPPKGRISGRVLASRSEERRVGKECRL